MSSCTLTDQLLNDRYKIIRPLGKGGMGQTYLAEDTRRPGNPQCVVKQLKPASTDPKFLVTAKRLFNDEAVILEKLGRANDQIPQLLERFEKDGEFYMIQDFVDGHPLSSEMPLGERWSEAQVIQLLQEVLTVLDAVHQAGVIHRDIKPDNLIRRQDGKLCLIDFGAVKQVRTYQAANSQQISMSVAIGTPGYMPTEQAKGRPRPNSDLYALGMVAIQTLTGMLPSQLREDDNGEVIWRDQAEVNEGLATFLDKMVRYHFKERFETATEALQALHESTTAKSAQTVSNSQQSAKRPYQPTVEGESARNTENQKPDPVAQSEVWTEASTGEEQATGEFSQRTVPKPQHIAPTSTGSSSKTNQVLLGIGVTIASCLLTGGSWFFWHQNQRQDAITQIKSSTEAGKYDECLKKTNWSLSNDTEIQSLLAVCQLGKARQLANKNDLKGAITTASQIPVNVPAYGQAPVLIQQWADAILNQATTLYQQGKFDEAVLTAKSIPQNPFNDQRKIQDAIKKWSDERAANNKLLTNARAMLNNGKWQSALDEVSKVKLSGKAVAQNSDYWNREIASIVKVANSGIANERNYDEHLQQAAMLEVEKKKLEELQVSTSSSGSLSRQESLNLIDKWLQSKSSIFASPFDRNLAESLTTGKMLEDITKPGGSIDWLQQNNAYYRYGTGKVEPTGYFSVISNQVEIDVRVTQGLEFYTNGTLNQSKTDTGTYRFTIVLKNGEWKIANRTEI